VNPGKLSIMVGDFATERFDVVFVGGAVGGLNYGRLVHGFLIGENQEREMMPGIAEEWNVSEDGLEWSFVIRDGVKWHDGSEATAEDVHWTFQHYYGPHAMEYDLSLIAKVYRVLDEEGIALTEPNTVSIGTTSPVLASAL
jgi:peptide/nickel transport system substrate-binding protein